MIGPVFNAQSTPAFKKKPSKPWRIPPGKSRLVDTFNKKFDQGSEKFFSRRVNWEFAFPILFTAAIGLSIYPLLKFNQQQRLKIKQRIIDFDNMRKALFNSSFPPIGT